MEALYIDNEKLPLKKHVAVTCHYRQNISFLGVVVNCFFLLLVFFSSKICTFCNCLDRARL